MLLAGTRCHRKTALGSQFCFAHLAKKGLKEVPVYKSNHHSRVIDTISKIVSTGFILKIKVYFILLVNF